MDKVLVTVINAIQENNPGKSDKINIKVDALMKFIKDDMNKVMSFIDSFNIKENIQKKNIGLILNYLLFIVL